MKLLRGLHNAGFDSTGCVATIGNFDGVHLGHQSVIRQLRAKAKVKGLPAVAIVFEPQPLEFFKGDQAPARIQSFREKFEALAWCHVDAVFCLKFDASLSRLSAGEFVTQVLLEHLQIKHLVVGDDFRFGGDRSGDFEFLKEAGAASGFSVENTPTQTDMVRGERVSSTRVRQALSTADFALVERLLGRPYSISGPVLHGEKLGRTLGFATANIALKRRSSPLKGVYAVVATLEDGSEYKGVANLGVKPTVGSFRANLEVHLFDFEGDLYGQRLTVRFVEKIRDEQKFSGLEQLTAQIQQDAKRAREILA